MRLNSMKNIYLIFLIDNYGSVLRRYKWFGATHLGDLLLMVISTNGSVLRT